MIHRTEIDYPGGLEQLANDLGDLRYDVLAKFLGCLMNKIDKDSLADRFDRNRIQLAGYLESASESIFNAWTVCEPYMKENENG